jgi:hypothetical protein
MNPQTMPGQPSATSQQWPTDGSPIAMKPVPGNPGGTVQDGKDHPPTKSRSRPDAT